VVPRRGIARVLNSVFLILDPDLYSALEDWGYDGFVIGDDTAVRDLAHNNLVASDTACACTLAPRMHTDTDTHIAPLSSCQPFSLNGSTQVAQCSSTTTPSLPTKTSPPHLSKTAQSPSPHSNLASAVSSAQSGLFDNPYIPEDIDSAALTAAHEELAMDAARHAIVLLENRNATLPLDPKTQNIKKIALVGPFADTLNFGDYSGLFGSNPGDRAITVRQAMGEYIKQNASDVQLVTSWGSNSWLYNGQYPIPAYLLSTPNNTAGGLEATYFSDTNFSQPVTVRQEIPNRDWGLYPPQGLSSNNFSATWEGSVTVPSDAAGWFGVAIGPNSTAKLFVDDQLKGDVPFGPSGNILGNIPSLTFSQANGTAPPPGSASFSFKSGATHKVRIEFQTWNLFQKLENVNSVNAQIQLFWNLVDKADPVGLATQAAKDADVVVFVGGGAWNSDGESGDRATMGLSPNQSKSNGCSCRILGR
jgi:Glycosyl hydrolase family 3 C-terminal domain/PA14 domain